MLAAPQAVEHLPGDRRIEQTLTRPNGANPAVLYQNALTVGVLEAHGLAGLLGLSAVRFARRGPDVYWHLLLALAHLLLGVANIAFFNIFVRAKQPAFGVLVTVIHFAFVTAQTLAVLCPDRVLAYRYSEHPLPGLDNPET